LDPEEGEDIIVYWAKRKREEEEFLRRVTHESALDTDPMSLPANVQLAMVIHLWKTLLLHDEVLSARRLLESIPWMVRESEPALLSSMRKMTDDMLAHIDRPERYRGMYETYANGKESVPMPADIRQEWSQYARYRFALDSIAEVRVSQSRLPTVLDVGCLDGWITNRLGLGRLAQPYGIDFSSPAVRLASAKAADFGTGAQHVWGFFGQGFEFPEGWPEQFDVVMLFEIYEHVPDTKALLEAALEFLAPGGLLLLSTPRGSWCQGHQVSFHERWNERKPREHIRAPVAFEVEEELRGLGLVEVSSQMIPIQVPDVPGQASLCLRGTKPVNQE
jgi:SAM-dependent methyltransferase